MQSIPLTDTFRLIDMGRDLEKAAWDGDTPKTKVLAKDILALIRKMEKANHAKTHP